MNYKKEIGEIGDMLRGMVLMSSIRKEVSSVMRGGFVVCDGGHYKGGKGYDVVVRCGGHSDEVARRLRGSIGDVRVDKISDGILGITQSRRGK